MSLYSSLEEAKRRTLDFLGERKRAYHLVFRLDQPADMEVLRDLAWFCRANESAAVPGDHDRTWALVGRREVFLRITQHLKLTPEQLFELYSYQQPRIAPKEASDQ